MRVGGGLPSKEIQNEARAAMKLSGFPNVVSVFDWGNLHGSPYFFLDMELCDLNLEHFILRQWPSGLVDLVPSFTRVEMQDPSFRLVQIWEIMRDISAGVAYIHDCGEVHRDLKPRNGTNLRFNFLIFSAVF